MLLQLQEMSAPNFVMCCKSPYSTHAPFPELLKLTQKNQGQGLSLRVRGGGKSGWESRLQNEN